MSENSSTYNSGVQLYDYNNLPIYPRVNVENISFMHLCNHKEIRLNNVTVKGIKTAPFIKKWSKGGEIIMENLETDSNKEIVDATEKFFTQCI